MACDNVDLVTMSQLVKHEGFRSKPYEDTMGILTIGYGFNLSVGISEQEAAFILGRRVAALRHRMPMVIKFFNKLSSCRQVVLLNMAYNIGISGLLKFRKMLAAMEKEKFNVAASEMLDSLWAIQVGDEPGQRAYDLAIMMCEG